MVLTVKVDVSDHFHPKLGNLALRIGQHGVYAGQRCRRTFSAGLVDRVQEHAYEKGLSGLLPVVFKAFAVRINN
jgi:hypothetical protein